MPGGTSEQGASILTGMARQRVIVAGGGLSGLAAAFDLVRGGADVRVLEASGRPGGVVGTIERDGFRFETGPNTVPASAESFRRLCGDLGIAERLIASSPAGDERYLFLRGRLRRLPSSPAAFLLSPVLSPLGRLRVITEPFRRFRRPPADQVEPTLAAFVAERLGPEAAQVLAGAFVRGVYAAELDELGARSAFPRMWKACEQHGGLVRGLVAAARRPKPILPGPTVRRTALISFQRGLVEIVEALRDALGERLRTGQPVERLERTPSGWTVHTRSEGSLAADRVVLAVPAPVAAGWLEGLGAAERIVDSVRGIAHADVTLVHFGLEAGALRARPHGFGYLVPPRAGEDAPRALGSLFPSNLFPGRAPEGCVAVSSFYASVDVEGLDAPALARLACEDLARALGESRLPTPRVVETRRWRDVIPRYAPGHAARMEEVETRMRRDLPGLRLAGCYVAGVSVDDVIARGRAVAREILG